MRHTKFLSIMAFVMVILLVGCKGSFKQTKNDLDPKSKVGRSTFRAGQMNQKWFDEFKMYAFRSIGEDEDLSEEEKAEQSKRIDKMAFRKNGITFFTMVNNVPMLDSERPQNFTVLDKNGKEYLQETDLVTLKIYQISQYGTNKSYNYTYILNTEEMDIAKMPKEIRPITLTANFPEDKVITYTIE